MVTGEANSRSDSSSVERTELSTHPSVSPDTSAETERKLWLDYLAKLNDRELQKERASGATNWVLLAITIATLYKLFQALPRLVEANTSWLNIGALFALELDFLILLGIVLGFLFAYCKGSQERRIFPELKVRAHQILAVLIHTSQVGLIVLHLVTLRLGIQPTFVRWTLGLFALFWLANLVSSLRKYLKRLRITREHKISIPITTVDFPATGAFAVIGVLLITPIAILGAVGLFLCIRSLMILSPNTWLLSFNAASQMVGVYLLLFFLFARGLYSQSRTIYLELERDIVMEKLPIEIIRRRFILEVIGPEIADWLTSATDDLERNQKEFQGLLELTETACGEIENIDAGYPLEREGRANEVSAKLAGGLKTFRAKHLAVATQLQESVKIHKLVEFEHKAIRDQLEQLSKSKQLLAKHGELAQRLSILKERGKNRERSG